MVSMEGRRRSPASAEAPEATATSSGLPTAPLQARGQVIGRERCRLLDCRPPNVPPSLASGRLALQAVSSPWAEANAVPSSVTGHTAVPDGRSREVVSEPSVAKGGHVVKKLVCALA